MSKRNSSDYSIENKYYWATIQILNTSKSNQRLLHGDHMDCIVLSFIGIFSSSSPHSYMKQRPYYMYHTLGIHSIRDLSDVPLVRDQRLKPRSFLEHSLLSITVYTLPTCHTKITQVRNPSCGFQANSVRKLKGRYKTEAGIKAHAIEHVKLILLKAKCTLRP